jgi:PAS domain S-box-containing protein
MDESLKLSEQNYQYLFDNASDAIWIHDLNGFIVVANKASERLTGYPQHQLIGKNVRDFLAEGSLNMASEVRQQLLSGDEVNQHYEQQLIRRDGTIRTMKMATSLVVIDDEPRGFQNIAQDITEEKQLQENMHFYIQLITRAQEDERKRISRELHDDVSSCLILLTQQLDRIMATSRPRLSRAQEDNLEKVRTQAVEALERLRRCARDLRPHILDDMGLIAALEWMAEDIGTNHGIKINVDVTGDEPALVSEEQVTLFRIAQEALNNIWRHAKASKASIKVEFEKTRIRITITDDGQGFQVPQKIESLASSSRLGIMGMLERARLFGGTLTVNSELGKGTRIVAELKVSEVQK